MTTSLSFVPGKTPLSTLRSLARSEGPAEVALPASTREVVETCVKAVDAIIASGKASYGINTGFGKLAQTRIANDELSLLQRNLVLSHSAGTGPLLPPSTVRLVMALKLISLSRGHSGVRFVVIEQLQKMLAADVLPCIPSKGSVGASGDLAPLAHMTAAMLGIGSAWYKGEILPADQALTKVGLSPLTLGPKEGLALLNGTQVSTALALIGLFAAEDVFAAAMVAGSLSVDALRGSDTPFDARIHAVRGHEGQIRTAALYRRLLAGSEIRKSHIACDKVQDPYSLRCQPQVMGACWDMIANAAKTIVVEANAVSDNPLVFPDSGDVLSGGNFHAEPVAMAADTLAIAIAEIGALSERRLALLIDPNMSNLPAFLVKDGGVNSGFMIAQVTAAALASENKTFAHPASVDSLPTSANQEDHVSMATFAARRLGDMADNTAGIVAIEMLAAAQGIEFLRPARSSEVLETIISALRTRVAPYDKDRFFAPDIEATKEMLGTSIFFDLVAEDLPSGIKG